MSASGTFDIGWHSLPFSGHYFYNLSDFEVPTDGNTKKTPIVAYLWMEVVEDGKSGGSLLNDTGGKSRPGVGPCKKTSFTVTVTNEPKSGTVNGSGGVRVSGSDTPPSKNKVTTTTQ